MKGLEGLISCRDDAERGRLLDLSRRLRGTELYISLLFLAAAAIAAPTFGWAACVPALPGLALFWLLQRRIERFRRPEIVLLACATLMQVGLAASLAIAHGPRIYLLPLMIMPVLLVSAVFPVRVAVAFVALSVLMMIVVAFGFDFAVVRRLPFALLYPLAIMICGAGIEMVVASLDSSTRAAAIFDPLTGLPNRVALRSRVAELEHQSTLTGRPVALIVGDPDRFKLINDRRGHAVGDAVLREIGARIRTVLRSGSSGYRLGGEEFVILLADADAAAGAELAERLREAICSRAIEGLAVAMSFGVAASEAGKRFAFSQLFGEADRALYEAKRAGGNRVRLWPLATDATLVSSRASESDRERAPLAPEQSGAEVVQRWDHWKEREHAATGNWLVSDELQRRQLLELNRRLRERAKPAFAIVLFVGSLCAIQYGWAILVPPIVMGAVYVLVEHHIERFPRPEYALGLAWLALEISFVAAGLLANAPQVFAAPLLFILVIGSSAVFPPRGVLVGLAVSSFALIAVALGEYETLFLHAPGVLACDLAMLISIGMLGVAMGRSTIEHRDLGIVDELTGLFNRGALMTRVAELAHRLPRAETMIAVVVIDVDSFKAINDTHGHAIGDAVLRELGQRVRKHLRAFESAYRVGGEEFVLLLEARDEQDIHLVAQRLREAIRQTPLAGVPTTVSLGIATSPPAQAFDYEATFRRADRALYEAKRAGGDRVALADGRGVSYLGALAPEPAEQTPARLTAIQAA